MHRTSGRVGQGWEEQELGTGALSGLWDGKQSSKRAGRRQGCSLEWADRRTVFKKLLKLEKEIGRIYPKQGLFGDGKINKK